MGTSSSVATTRSSALLLSVVLILVSADELSTQSYPIRNYTEGDGLPSSTVHDLTQDPSGRMWF
ncbi:MAG: hypothetical protein GY856_35100, partial [bacterium]|nr:hypothetical protein [bacterium]